MPEKWIFSSHRNNRTIAANISMDQRGARSVYLPVGSEDSKTLQIVEVTSLRNTCFREPEDGRQFEVQRHDGE